MTHENAGLTPEEIKFYDERYERLQAEKEKQDRLNFLEGFERGECLFD